MKVRDAARYLRPLRPLTPLLTVALMSAHAANADAPDGHATATSATTAAAHARPTGKLEEHGQHGVIDGEAIDQTHSAPAQSVATAQQSDSKGLFAGSHLKFLLRSYSDHLETQALNTRNAWVLGSQLNFESGFSTGAVGFGADAGLFSALKLNGGNGIGNMVHVDPNGGGGNQAAWTYFGLYDIKARVSNTVLKTGAQIIHNPFLEPHDNRALPPSFLGTTISGAEFAGLNLAAGSVTKTQPREQTRLRSLSSAYGDTEFKRFSYLGGDYNYSPDTRFSLYASRADDVWTQYYSGLSHSIGDAKSIRWSGQLNYYATRNQGRSLQGTINTNAYSVALSAQHRAHTVMLAYQKIQGKQFFDYVGEGAGDFLSNSMNVDYNAPGEQSLQLRHTVDLGNYGLPGLRIMSWLVQGWGADASATAASYAGPASSLYGLYWKNGEAVHGKHWEIGMIPTYVIQAGRLKGSSINLTLMHHHATSHYSDPSNNIYRLVINMPFNIF
ncbi:OprD family outer membrane porin [Collimonas sp.]|uniref:OprD family outer membrane porin n=1 Tax=Collimonas sp. TaxID=1963772 RepID=UPI002C36A2DE|nr:OprD family outer membrane porin [Collimonas sp.]HWW05218.1 OprD family outer membrane porin [Collimonas sp.]